MFSIWLYKTQLDNCVTIKFFFIKDVKQDLSNLVQATNFVHIIVLLLVIVD